MLMSNSIKTTIVDFYIKRIKAGRLTLDNVPEPWKDMVKEKMEQEERDV